MIPTLRFVTKNPKKFKETKSIMSDRAFNLIKYEKSFEEIKAKDPQDVVKDKLIKAFKEIRRPLFVEHTGLYLPNFKNFPGGLTQSVFDDLGERNFSKFFGSDQKSSATAKTIIGYTDGKIIKTDIKGETKGRISRKPKGPSGEDELQWDCVFIPDEAEHYDGGLTFAELGDRKHKYSMRRKALEGFLKFLNEYSKDKKNQNLINQKPEKLKKLKKLVEEGDLILFVGSGVSRTLYNPRNYRDAPPLYDDIINHFASKLGYSKELFKLHANNTTLADFYCRSKSNGIGSFAEWMGDQCSKHKEKINKSEIYELITRLNCNVLFTTNYDSYIEDAYKNFSPDKQSVKVVTTLEHMRKNKDGKPIVVKFHGDLEDESTIVLTESDYFKRLDFENPLDIMLRSEAFKKPILYIGYSLSDINLRYLLYKMEQSWQKQLKYLNRSSNKFYKRVEKLNKLRGESYIFLSKPNPIQSLLFEEYNVQPIVSMIDKPDKPNEGLANFLRCLVGDNNCKKCKYCYR